MSLNWLIIKGLAILLYKVTFTAYKYHGKWHCVISIFTGCHWIARANDQWPSKLCKTGRG